MITGHFISVEVPEVAVGQEIMATIDFYAQNPGALYWSTFLVADSPGLGLRKLLDKARETFEEGGRKKTYSLGTMPNKEVAISFFLFAHDDAVYDWNWGEYAAWLDGFPIEVTHLASDYRFISPGAEPPPQGFDISGLITSVYPSQIAPGQPLDLYVDFNAYNDSLYYQLRGWETKVTATLNGYAGSDIQFHYGRDGSRTGQSLQLGTMPSDDLSGEVTLYGRNKKIPQAAFTELHTKSVSIMSIGVEPPPGNGNGDEPPPPGADWGKVLPWVAIGAGVLLIASPKRSPKPQRRR